MLLLGEDDERSCLPSSAAPPLSKNENCLTVCGIADQSENEDEAGTWCGCMKADNSTQLCEGQPQCIHCEKVRESERTLPQCPYCEGVSSAPRRLVMTCSGARCRAHWRCGQVQVHTWPQCVHSVRWMFGSEEEAYWKSTLS